MTELRPCPACRRHVAIAEATCPFCAVALAPATPRTLIGGRLSRAAVFATGALAATACGGGTKAKDAAPPPIAHDATAAVAPPVDAAVALDAAPVVVDAMPLDAHPPADAAVAKKKIVHPIPDHPNPKPYGAPPARRRLV